MKVLDLEIQKVGITVECIINEFGGDKFVGLISDTSVKTDNGKCIGKVILLLNPKKKFIVLNQIVEFIPKYIKYEHNYAGNDNFYLISDHWVKSYAPEIKIEVPIKILDFETKKEITIMRELTHKQFQENRLLEFYGKYSYRFIKAYKNFTDLFRNNQRYYAINSTVRNYRIPQDKLESLIGVIGNEKRKIKTEWLIYLSYHVQQHEAQLKLQNLMQRYKQSITKKVVNLKK